MNFHNRAIAAFHWTHSSLSFEWAGNLCACMSLWLSGKVMMETVSFFFFWSHTLHIVIHTMNGVPLLPWCENRPQSPIASYNQFMSFFIYGRCSYVYFDSHSIIEFSDSCFCSAFCRRGKWDLVKSEKFLSWRPYCGTCFLPKFAKIETKEGFMCRKILLGIIDWCLMGLVDNKLPQTLFICARICLVVITGNSRFVI